MAGKAISRVMSLQDKVSPALKKIESNTKKFGDTSEKTKSKVNQMWSSIQTGAGRTAAAIGRTTIAVSKMGLVVGGVAAVAMIGLGKSALDTAADLEGYRSVLETVLKDSKKAGEAFRWATQFANKTPFDTSEVVEATAKLSAYGLVAQDVLPSVGNMAAAMNKPLDQAVEAIADAQSGELERMKEFGVTKAMLIKKANEMYRDQEVVNNQGQIVDQEKFNKAIFALMDERFAGGMEKQAKTWKGVVSTVKGIWSTGLAKMIGITDDGTARTGSLFDRLKGRLEDLGSRLTKWSEDGTFDKIASKFDSMVGKAEEKLVELKDKWPEIKQWFKDLKDQAEPIGKAFGDTFNALSSITKWINDNPAIASALGIGAAGAFVGSRMGLFGGGADAETVGVQNVQAGVVNVYGTVAAAAGGGLAGAGGASGTAGGKSGSNTAAPVPDSSLPSRKQTHSKIKLSTKVQNMGGNAMSKAQGAGGKAASSPWALLAASVALPLVGSEVSKKADQGVGWAKFADDTLRAIQGLPSRQLEEHLNQKQAEEVKKTKEVMERNKQETQKVAEELRILQSLQKNQTPPQITINTGGMTVREEADIEKITNSLAKKIKMSLLNTKPFSNLPTPAGS